MAHDAVQAGIPARLTAAPYDRTALRDRIGDAVIAQRSIESELRSEAQSRIDGEVDTPPQRKRRPWRRKSSR
ncbi:MAG: hypothetical protein ACXWXS_09620 [Actinomycetota bacterium]